MLLLKTEERARADTRLNDIILLDEAKRLWEVLPVGLFILLPWLILLPTRIGLNALEKRRLMSLSELRDLPEAEP